MSHLYIDNRQYNSGPDHITVEHKRAPTDASIAILKEMESKILDKIIVDLPVVDNVFNFHGIYIRPDFGNDIVCYSFSLNGKNITGKFDLPYIGAKKSADSVIKAIYECLSKDIAGKLMELVFSNTDSDDYFCSLRNYLKFKYK